MVTKNSKAQGKKTGKAKTAGKKDQTSVDRLLEMQQKAVSRYATYASNVANRLSQGDLNLSSWVEDYSKVWKDLADDMQAMVKAILPASK